MLWLITTQAIPGKSGTVLMARILGYAGEVVNQASFSAIAYAVQDLTTNVLASSGTLTIANVIFNSLQIDALWTKDSKLQPGDDGNYGYNFKTILKASLFSPGGDRYHADVKFTPVLNPAVPGSDEPFVCSWEWPTSKVYT